MTSRENVLAFFTGKPYDYIPVENVDTKAFLPEEVIENVARGFVFQQTPYTGPKGGKGWFNVEWVFEAQAKGAIDVGRVIDDICDWENVLEWPDLDEIDWKGIAERNSEYLDTDRLIQTKIFSGYFERLISFMDFTDASIALVDPDCEESLLKLFDRLTDLYIDYASRLKKYCNVELIEIHDDWGNQRSAMMSLETHRKLFLPCHKKLINAFHDMGIIYMQHSCGNVTDLFPDFIASGTDTWYGQDNAVDKLTLTKQYGDKFLFEITMDPPVKTDEAVEAYTKETLDTYSPYKVWYRVLGRSNTPEHTRYMQQAIRNYKGV